MSDELSKQYDIAWKQFNEYLATLGVNHPKTIEASKLVDKLHKELTAGQEPYNGLHR